MARPLQMTHCGAQLFALIHIYLQLFAVVCTPSDPKGGYDAVRQGASLKFFYAWQNMHNLLQFMYAPPAQPPPPKNNLTEQCFEVI
jgi:hypothetical protein